MSSPSFALFLSSGHTALSICFLLYELLRMELDVSNEPENVSNEPEMLGHRPRAAFLLALLYLESQTDNCRESSNGKWEKDCFPFSFFLGTIISTCLWIRPTLPNATALWHLACPFLLAEFDFVWIRVKTLYVYFKSFLKRGDSSRTQGDVFQHTVQKQSLSLLMWCTIRLPPCIHTAVHFSNDCNLFWFAHQHCEISKP